MIAVQEGIVQTDMLPTSYTYETKNYAGFAPALSLPRRYIAIIPARGNSKGIPGKNMKLLGGKPLVSWTIDAALKSEQLSLIALTSEDENTRLFVAQEYKTVVPLVRPVELSQDFVQLDDVYLNAAYQLENLGIHADSYVFLAPTSPFRTSEDINRAVEIHESNGYATVVACYVNQKFHWIQKENGYGSKIFPMGHDPEHRKGRQWITGWPAVETGGIYVVDAQKFIEARTVRFEPYVPCLVEKKWAIELDESEDWVEAERLCEIWCKR